MSAAALLDSVLGVVALAAMAAAGLTLAARLAARGLPRLLAAIVLAAALAVLQALILGRFGLGGSPLALTLLAVAIAVITWRLAPPVAVPALAELASTLRGGGALGLATGGAVAGALVAIAAIELHRPGLGQDAITYHLPEVVAWVQNGHTGRVQNVFYGLPVGNYPVTEEVLLSWITGITHGFSAALMLTLATVPLLLLAGWLGLRELDVPAPLRVLALAALVLTPLIAQAWVEPGTDLEATTWLACAGALCLAARRQPGLLAAAVVAAGLAIGTKTTVASYSVVLIVVALWFRRRDLRAHWRSLGAAFALAIATGLIWYLRNWVDHGSPLWPFSSFPSGDPRPEIIDYLSVSLLRSLHATLLDHLHGYVSGLSGAVVLIIGGILTVVPGATVARRRVLIAGAVVALGTLEYAAGPVTGLPPGGGLLVSVVGSTLRYLMPVFLAGALALALTAADPHRVVAALGWVALLAAVVWELVTDLPDGLFLSLDWYVWPGLVLGALVALGLRRRLTRGGAGRGLALSTGLGLLIALALAAGASGFAVRHALTHDFGQDVSVFLESQPAYANSDVPVATTKGGFAQLAGDRLQHPLSVIPQHAGCRRIDAIARTHWIVVTLTPPAATIAGIPRGVLPYGTALDCLLRAGAHAAENDGSFAVVAPFAAS